MDNNFNKNFSLSNMFKARNGEFLIEHLLQKLDYKVYRFGYETALQNIFNLGIKLKNNDTKEMINFMPDFLVIDPKGEMTLIEVKLRTNITNVLVEGRIKEKAERIKKYYPECLLVIVDGEECNPIKACYVKDYNSLKDLKPFRDLLFDSKKEENLEIIKEVEDLAKDFVKRNKLNEKNETPKDE